MVKEWCSIDGIHSICVSVNKYSICSISPSQLIKNNILLLRPKYDFNTSVASLRINNAGPGDAGVYTAIATNPLGRAETSARLYTTSVPTIDQTPQVNPDAFKYLEHSKEPQRKEEDVDYQAPKVIVPLSNHKLKEGESLFLPCKIIGTPKPKVRFFN